MTIVRAAFSQLLKPGLAWHFFLSYYPKRQPMENGSRYYRRRLASYRTWCEALANRRNDEGGGYL